MQEKTQFNDEPFMLTLDLVSASFRFSHCSLSSIGGSGLIRSSPALDHIPLYSTLYGGVYCEGLVTCCFSLSSIGGSGLAQLNE